MIRNKQPTVELLEARQLLSVSTGDIVVSERAIDSSSQEIRTSDSTDISSVKTDDAVALSAIPGNSITSLIESTGIHRGSISSPGEIDWHAFQARNGYNYNFETRLRSLNDSVLWLVDQDRETTLAYNDDRGVGLASRIEWKAHTSGTFFVVVSAYDRIATGDYDLWITESPAFELGDFNRDGDLNATDIDRLYDAIASADPHPQYDLNRDQILDQGGVDCLVRDLLGTNYGDANLKTTTHWLMPPTSV